VTGKDKHAASNAFRMARVRGEIDHGTSHVAALGADTANTRGMRSESTPQRWSTKRFALFGAALGVFGGIIHNYVHAFWSHPVEENLIEHIQTRMVIFPVIGAAGLAAVAAIRNWLVRRP